MVANFPATLLWDDYGIISDLIVRPTISPPSQHLSTHMFFSQSFTNDFPRADIHELLTFDLLHQVIKGGFKDHLVSWVEEYLILVHGKAGAKRRMADIDRR